MCVLGDRLCFKGEIPKWPTGADCKSAGECLRRFESCSPHLNGAVDRIPLELEMMIRTSWMILSGSSSVGRALAFQAKGRGFEFRFPLTFDARVAQG